MINEDEILVNYSFIKSIDCLHCVRVWLERRASEASIGIEY